jgi:hypothetical protein
MAASARELDGTLRDLRVVAELHEDRLDAVEPRVADVETRLGIHDRKFVEHEGYLALLDRAHGRLEEQIDMLSSVNAELGRVIGELRRRGQNGS